MNSVPRRIIALLAFLGAGVCAQYDRCTGEASWLKDGRCDRDNNIADCGYDGGDCCYCSCVDGPDYSCGVVGFDCRDPEYMGDEVSDCTGELPVDVPCSTDISTQLVVNDTASANDLADVIRCSGGAFSVAWLGSVDVNRTIKVTTGTVLHVTGVQPGAKIQAVSSIQLFTVVNASLELENVAIAGGFATFGGAIAAAASYISLENTSFVSNGAVFEGGAIHATLGSIASFGEGIHFDGNHAGFQGGALNFGGASSGIFHGYTSFSNCVADGYGGALFVSSSTLSWTGGAIFVDNTATEGGGALCVFYSHVSWSGDVVFSDNAASLWGGALCVSDSNMSWSGDAKFFNNNTTEHGGALLVYASDMSWSGHTVFSDNSANVDGGALFVSASNISWSGDALFSENTADGWGGALYISSSRVSWSGNAVFSGNTATEQGGALYIYFSDGFWSGDAVFSDSTANVDGGAVFIFQSNTSWSGNAVFSDNTATVWGGALYISYSDVSWSGDAKFSNNNATEHGGALFVYSSDMSWSGHIVFSNNTASEQGGALYVFVSTMSWSRDVVFFNNTAKGWGGALFVSSSNVSLSGYAVVYNNTAHGWGGALYISFSHVSWSGNAVVSGNTATEQGGALYIDFSDVYRSGDAVFSDNTANQEGGAILVFASNMYWSGDAVFSDNNATENGGALYILGSDVSWSGDTVFSNNTANGANGDGGALGIFASNTSWSGDAVFSDNTATVLGGALYIFYSFVSWSGDIVFSNNNANNGGALGFSFADVSWSGRYIFFDNTADAFGGALYILFSEVFWSGDAVFSDNTASEHGGALYVVSSNMSLSSDAVYSEIIANRMGSALDVEDSDTIRGTRAPFFNNAAGGNGGALCIIDGARVVFELDVAFLRNSASGDGGAVFVYGNNDAQASSLYVTNNAAFQKNFCGGDGGALAVVAAGEVTFATTNVTFSHNSAHSAGGAVAVKGLRVGPQFKGFTFVSNHAQIGGAAYITNSGTAISEDPSGVSTQHPTTFDLCKFIGNEAEGTGGAIDTGAGRDEISNTYFASNIARAGGALKLAGIISLSNCTFTENMSDNGEGSAVANFGFVSSISASFVDNGFKCEPREYLDYREMKVNGVLDVVCKGCSECDNCTTSLKVPACSAELEHTKSAGGNTTIEALKIDRGYWRATNTSRKVLKCYNADACSGGVTGASSYCSAGYEGPYCSICLDGYSPSLGYTCSECSGGTGSVAITIATSSILLMVLLLFCQVRGVSTGTGRGRMTSWRRRFLSLKIVVIVWQITTQFASLTNVRYPDVYQRFLDDINILNIDISRVLSMGCIIDLDFHRRLFISTLGPAAAFTVLGATYAVHRRIYRRSYDDFVVSVREEGNQKCVSLVLLLTFLVYSPVSSTLFQMFACDELDDGRNYLRADYRIDCNSSTHRCLQVYAACMILVYTAGIPILYSILLFRNRQVLMDKSTRQEDAAIMSTSSLWKLYKPHRFYYELIECARRILLAGVVVFIFPNTPAQVAVALVIAAFFMVLSEMVAPYESLWDAWISRIGHAIVFSTIYMALLLKTDVSDERDESQGVFGALLVAGQACMVLLVASGGIVVTCQLMKWSL